MKKVYQSPLMDVVSFMQSEVILAGSNLDKNKDSQSVGPNGTYDGKFGASRYEDWDEEDEEDW